MRWARITLCALAGSLALLTATAPASFGGAPEPMRPRRPSPGPHFRSLAQTAWVSPAAPWFALTAAVASHTGPIGDLHVEVTFYNRIDNETEFAQATNAVPDKGVLGHLNAPLTASASGRMAATCTIVVPEDSITPPTTAPPNTVACPPGSPTLILGCTPDEGVCGGVYPVSVALYRQGTDPPLARFTTFLTYQEPGVSASDGPDGPLRVGLVVPVSAHLSPAHESPSGRRAAIGRERDGASGGASRRGRLHRGQPGHGGRPANRRRQEGAPGHR